MNASDPLSRSSDARERVRVGVIVGAHGIRGEVKLRSFTADPAAIATYGPLASAKGEVLTIARIKPQKDGFIAAFKGVSDRNRAEALKGTELFVARSQLPDPDEGEVYAHDLIGLAVTLKDGVLLGEIVAMPNYGAGDLLEVRAEGRKDTVLIPFAPTYVMERTAERVVVDLPEGYLDDTA